jgi:hypothetical protein
MDGDNPSWKTATWKQLAAVVIGVPTGLLIMVTSGAKLAGVEFGGALSFLNIRGLWILVIPMAGLFAIFRHGRWSGWKVVNSSRVLSVIVWIGWTVALVVGVVDIIARI